MTSLRSSNTQLDKVYQPITTITASTPASKPHNGKLLEKAVKESGISKSALAGKLQISRPTLYGYFKREVLSTDLMFKIGYLINYDFGSEIDRPYVNGFKKNNESVPGNDADHWKNKYIDLLEDYKNILSRFVESKG